MNGFLYTLTLEEPLLANSLGGDPNSADSLFYIPGGALRGAFIQAYDARQDAADEDFRRLFLSGETCYLNAYPFVTGKRTLPAPLTWQTERKPAPAATKQVYRDISVVPQDTETKSVPFSFWLMEAKTLRSVEEEWQINVHTQRDAVRGRATTEAGAVYRYIALPAGMKLQGAVLTQNPEDAQKLAALLKGKSILLGKARTAGYGSVIVEISSLPENWRESGQEFPSNSETCTLTLLSPALVRNENGQFSLEIEPALKAHLGNQIELMKDKIHRRPEIIGGFNRKWGLPLPQMTALAAGSVFTVSGATAEKLRELEASGIGERRAEGFGRVAVNLNLPEVVDWKPIELELDSVAEGELPANDPLAQRMLTRLLRRDLDEQTIRAARRAMESYTGNIPNSQLSRWRVLLRDALPKRDINRVKQFCASSKGKPGWKKMERARVKIGNTSPRLTEWIESALDDPKALSQAWDADFKPERRLGSNSIQLDEGLNAEYRLRLLDAVLAVMAKSGDENGN